MQNPDSSIWIKGPVTEGTGHATFVPQWIRLNIPVLAGLPEGSLPILQDWRMPDGTLLSDLYLQFAGHTKHASAKRLVHKLKLDFGGTQFSWMDIVPDDGWGAHAIPLLPPVL